MAEERHQERVVALFNEWRGEKPLEFAVHCMADKEAQCVAALQKALDGLPEGRVPASGVRVLLEAVVREVQGAD